MLLLIIAIISVFFLFGVIIFSFKHKKHTVNQALEKLNNITFMSFEIFLNQNDVYKNEKDGFMTAFK